MNETYIQMREVTHQGYLEFIKTRYYVVIENTKIHLPKHHKISQFAPKNFTPELTTVWSFPDRGHWATHRGNYRANFSPYIPRNLILRFTNKNDLVLDQMVGSGTTLIECKLLQRRGIGVDINPDAIMVARNRLDFSYKPNEDYQEPEIKTYIGDARNLNLIQDESIDLIVTHPPYANIVSFSKHHIPHDISKACNIADFVNAMRKVAQESYRVLKPGKHCSILIGDTRRHKHFVPISPRVLQAFLDTGFILREDIIKLQWKMKATRERWRSTKLDFLKIAHEHLYIFRKPERGEKLALYKESMKW
ncbi:MAG: DNA methyltransferase [Methanocellales archaeon]